ncbi:MAG: SulP family inorganic anion transporter [Actinomycetes bacterium]
MGYISDLLPHRSDYADIKKIWRHDLIAGVTVGIVALPLALAFGITTGAGARAGLITAIYAGFIAAIFGGSNYQVSGPTGAMTVVLIPIVIKYGTASLAPLGLMAGAIVILMGITHCGGLIKRVPWPVMEGFTLGIALVIAMQQLPSVLASRSVSGPNTLVTAWRTIRSAINAGVHWSSLLILTIALFVKFAYPKISRALQIKVHIPASFVAIIFSTLVVALFSIHTPLIGNLPRSLYVHVSLSASHIGASALLIGAIQIALLAAIESLLSARVADQMVHIHESAQSYKPNRELVGQGLATMVSSMVGGMPATGAIARTSVNIRSKASSRISAISHAVFLLLVVLVLNPAIAHIPTAALGAVLIGASYRIANPGNIMEMLKTTRLDAVTLLLTAVLVVVIGLIWAIAISTAGYVLATIILNRAKR